MKLLITGGAGFIGSNFIHYWLKKYPEDEVVNLDKLTYAGNLSSLREAVENSPYRSHYRFVQGDICNGKLVADLMADVDTVVHFAAESIPEEIYLPVYSSTGTKMMTFKELWNQQRRNNPIQKNAKGETILLKGKQTKVLSFLNEGQWMPIKAITRHYYKGKIIKLDQKWGIIEATPNHSIYSANLELTNPENNPELLVIRNINENNKKYQTADYKLLTIIAAYITEGNATFNKANGGYIVEIGQKDKVWLEKIGGLIKEYFGYNFSISKGTRKNYTYYHLQISNKAFFNYLTAQCGKYCDGKFFPNWVFDLDIEGREFFWQKLLEGDGTKDGRYTTTSYKLTNQLSLLLSLLNKKYTVFERINLGYKKSWEFKTVFSGHHYGLNKRGKIELDYEGWVYDIEVEKTHNFVCGIGNIVCHNTHVDRSISGPQVFVKTNVVGTQVLLDAAIKNNIKRFHHVSCYDNKTRAFTKNGLKFYWELSSSDEILSLNLKTREIEWKRIEKVIIQDYEGFLIKIKSDRVDFLVTPNHRMLLETKRGNLLFKEAQTLGARNLLPKGYWEGKKNYNKNFMYLLGFFIGDGFLAYQEKVEKNLTGLSKKEYLILCRDKKTGRFRLTGKIGSQDQRVSRSYRIFLDVPKKDGARKKVEDVLTHLGINWHEHSGKAGEHLYFTSKKFSQIFKDCGNGAKSKRIPRWALEANTESLKALFDGLIDSDGYKSKDRLTFFTSSQKLAENFSELNIKISLTPHVFIRKSHPSTYKGRVIQGGDSYLITVAKTNRSIIPGYGLKHVANSAYKGKVWCVKVPVNKNLLVERNGVFGFCGNTDEVYGALSDEGKEKFDENWPFRPNSPYAAAKAGSDCLVRSYWKTYRLPVSISNTSNNYGPYQFPEKLIPLAITNLMEGKKVPVYGDGMQVRDWLYVEDHCRAIDLIVHDEKTIGETFCVGGLTKDIPNIQVVKKILKIMDKSEEDIEYVKDRPGHDRRYSVNWSKIKKTLGWEPKYDFDTWLEKTIHWYRNNTNWWKPLKDKQQKYFKKQYRK